MADIPGLIAGAHQGVGLGHRFLRHIERTRLIIYVLDVSGQEGRDPREDLRVLKEEITLYDPALTSRPQIVAANKIDLPEAAQNLTRLKKSLGKQYEIFPVSALTGEGLKAFTYRVAELIRSQKSEIRSQN